jgi:hypothetical protein
MVDSEAISEDGEIKVRITEVITGMNGYIGSMGVDYAILSGPNVNEPGLPPSTTLPMIGNYYVVVADMNGNPLTATQGITLEMSVALPFKAWPGSSQVFYFNPDTQTWEGLEVVASTNDWVTVRVQDFGQFAVLGRIENKVYLPLALRNAGSGAP